MAEYIDRTALGIGDADPKAFINPAHAEGWNTAIQIINEAPSADVVEVVRCKDCVYYSNNNLKSQWDRLGYCLLNEEITDDKREPSDFCSYGERKEIDNGKL